MVLPFDPIAEAERNWIARGWPNEQAMSAATAITRAHQIVLSRINTALRPFGLNFSRFEALALLSFTRQGELPLNKMGERLQVHPTSITNTIDRLEADGFVVRVPHPSDRRTTLARITDSGRHAADAAARVLGDIDFGLEGVAATQLRRIDDELTALRRDAGDFALDDL